MNWSSKSKNTEHYLLMAFPHLTLYRQWLSLSHAGPYELLGLELPRARKPAVSSRAFRSSEGKRSQFGFPEETKKEKFVYGENLMPLKVRKHVPYA